mgnify:CR=1 FL=1
MRLPAVTPLFETENPSLFHFCKLRCPVALQTTDAAHTHITRLNTRTSLLHFGMDAYICDAWSRQILLNDLKHNYLHPNQPQEPLAFTFRDYVLAEQAWRQQPQWQAAENWWATRLDELRDALIENEAQWWVVLGDAVDKVLGVANRDSLLSALVQNRGQLTPLDLSEPAEFVPEMIRADRLLTAFRRDNAGVRVVVDEFGGFVGVIGPDAVLAVLAGWWRKGGGGGTP